MNVGQVQLEIYKLWPCGGRKVVKIVQTNLWYRLYIYNFVTERSFVIVVFFIAKRHVSNCLKKILDAKI